MNVKKSIFGFFVISLLSLTCCTNKGDSFDKIQVRTPKEMFLKKEATFKLGNNISDLKEIKIGRIQRGFVKVPLKEIYAFYDNIFKQFLITDGQKLISVIGNKGKGPKEFIKVNSYNFDEEGNLIVFDSALRVVKIFDVTDKLIHSFKIQTSKGNTAVGRSILPLNDMFILGNIETKYLSDLDAVWQSTLIGIYNRKGILVDTFGKYDPYLKEINNVYNVFPVFNLDRENSLLFSSQTNSYRIQVYNLENKERTKYFGYRSPNFIETKDKITPEMSIPEIQKRSLGQSFTYGIYSTSKYAILYFENLTEKWYQTKDPNEKKHFIAVYNRSKEAFLDELELPFPIVNVVKDKLFLLENDDPQNYTLGIYDLVEKS